MRTEGPNQPPPCFTTILMMYGGMDTDPGTWPVERRHLSTPLLYHRFFQTLNSAMTPAMPNDFPLQGYFACSRAAGQLCAGSRLLHFLTYPI